MLDGKSIVPIFDLCHIEDFFDNIVVILDCVVHELHLFMSAFPDKDRQLLLCGFLELDIGLRSI